MSSLDDDFDQSCLESGSSDEGVTDQLMDSHTWNGIESDPDADFLEDHGLVEVVTSTLSR